MRGRQKQRVTLSKFIKTYNFNRFLANYSIITKKQFRQIYELMKMIQLDSVTMGNIQSIVANLIKYNVDCNYYDRYILLNTQYNKKNNLESYILRYGEFGEQLYNEKNKSTAITKENLINKHGEILGLEKWEAYRSKHKFIGTIDFYIEKFGKDLGPGEYKKSCEMRNSFRPELFKSEAELDNRKSLCKVTLDKMISKHGLTEGTNKYNDYNKWLTEDKCRTTSQVGFWVKQGFSEDEAKLKVKERQATGSLENFKKRHGDELGLQKWSERQVKWQQNYKKSNFSKVSQTLFWELYNNLIDKTEIYFAQLNNGILDDSGKNHEYTLKLNKSSIKPDFIDLKQKKIIEFDGTYWHRKNPENKKREDYRDRCILEIGYSILHVNEQDFKTNKQECIDKCIKFLSE